MHVDLNTCATEKGPGSIILLESDDHLLKSMAMAIWQETGEFPCTASSVDEAVGFIKEKRKLVLAVAVGFEAEGVEELLNTMVEYALPVVLYGDEFTDDIRKGLATFAIADVVTGESHTQVAGVGRSVARLASNRNTPVLVVDDSRSMRAALIRFLSTRCFKVYQAADGLEALEMLKDEPGIKLVITDNEMPNMDGFSLVREIRKVHSKDDLAVIGISAKTNSMLSVKFINNGANDFLQKPFVKEELYCRVDHNLDMLQRIAIIRDLSNKDPLTKLYNRRYFFDHCDAFVDASQADGRIVSVAMLDIDHFKKVNDAYGHDAGDEVLVTVSSLIAESFAKNAIVARFGGEEFCVLMASEQQADLFAAFDSVRRKVERTSVIVDDLKLAVSISIGVCNQPGAVRDMVKAADGLLYSAKESGRNRVIIS